MYRMQPYLMDAIVGKVRERAVRAMMRAYPTIDIEHLMESCGFERAFEAVDFVRELGVKVVDNVIDCRAQ